MEPFMLGDFSARSAGMPMTDFVYLQRRSAGRYLRRRRGGRRAAAATTARAAEPARSHGAAGRDLV